MKEYLNILRACPLFNQIEEEQLIALLGCLNAKLHHYQKGEFIFAEGSPSTSFGIVLAGEAQILRIDYYGNRSILSGISPGELFGESFACAEVTVLPVDVIAATSITVLLMEASQITTQCSKLCSFHNQMIYNLLKIVATKNLLFHQKIEVTSKRTTREKLMTYLLLQAKQQHSSSFTIPFDRQELADYLGVDRSGLSSEISKLRQENLLTCTKNKFTLAPHISHASYDRNR